ncbi:MAG: beta strand repeat-containing protein [Cyclobacteriaceae bacterium]
MKTKHTTRTLLGMAMVALMLAAVWSCKDEDPTLEDLREDRLSFLEDSLRISDSLSRINAAGIVNYAITVVNGSTSSIFNNPGPYGRSKGTKNTVAGAAVTISQYGKTQTDTTDATGMVVFNGFFRSAVNVTIQATDFTTASFVLGVSIQDSTKNSSISFVGNLLPIFETTGPNTSTVTGRATLETDLTNTTRETVPDGTNVLVAIDATNNSVFSDRFLTTDLENIYNPSCGCDILYVGEVGQAAYGTGVVGSTTGGNYTITVPAAIDGLPMSIRYSDLAADQTLFETTAAFGQRTIVNRTVFTTSTSAQALPASSSVTISFVSNTVDAAATAVISPTTGAIASVNVTNGGSGYNGTPLVEFLGGGGTGATGTATVTNGVLTGITVTNAGTGYTSAPSVNIIEGFGATATSALVADGTVVGVTITNSGSGYVAAPTVTFSPPGGTGVTATGTANIDAGGRVTSVTITNAGSQYTANPTVTFSAAPAGGTTATGVGIYSGQSVGAVSITGGGADYTYAPVVTFSAPQRANGVRATGTAVIDAATRTVVSITITNPGSGYTAAPTITMNAGSGAAGVAQLAGGSVISANITNQGADYAYTPIVEFDNSLSGGTGATATAVMSNGTSGKVIGITITNGGTGYTSAPTINFVVGDDANAFATVTNGAITAITVTDGGRNFSGAPSVVITSGDGGGATATATVAGGAITGVTVVSGGSGYLAGNTPSTAVGFSSTKGTSLTTYSGINYINDYYYGTGTSRTPN